MAKMTRAKALECIRSAGAAGDQRLFLRVYTENKISLAVARGAYAEGQRFAAAIAKRDAQNATQA